MIVAAGWGNWHHIWFRQLYQYAVSCSHLRSPHGNDGISCYRARPRAPPADRGAWRPTSTWRRLPPPAPMAARASARRMMGQSHLQTPCTPCPCCTAGECTELETIILPCHMYRVPSNRERRVGHDPIGVSIPAEALPVACDTLQTLRVFPQVAGQRQAPPGRPLPPAGVRRRPDHPAAAAPLCNPPELPGHLLQLHRCPAWSRHHMSRCSTKSLPTLCACSMRISLLVLMQCVVTCKVTERP